MFLAFFSLSLCVAAVFPCRSLTLSACFLPLENLQNENPIDNLEADVSDDNCLGSLLVTAFFQVAVIPFWQSGPMLCATLRAIALALPGLASAQPAPGRLIVFPSLLPKLFIQRQGKG